MSFEDVIICPTCGQDMYVYSTDEIDFGIDHKGHYNVDVYCPQCNKNERLYVHFKYHITKVNR